MRKPEYQKALYPETEPSLFWAWLADFTNNHSGLLSLQEQKSEKEPGLFVPGSRGFLQTSFYWRAVIIGWNCEVEITRLAESKIEAIVSCRNRSHRPTWENLVSAIVKRWPEADREAASLSLEERSLHGVPRLHVDSIDSFSEVRGVSPDDVAGLLDAHGYLDMEEDDIQTAIEDILNVSFHKVDWSGEENDLFTANVVVDGERVPAAFMLKGRGVTSRMLKIRDCGKNGDQLVRLFQSPAVLFIVQFVGEISENVIKDIEHKVFAQRFKNNRALYCVINGQDTARLLYAYGKLPQ